MYRENPTPGISTGVPFERVSLDPIKGWVTCRVKGGLIVGCRLKILLRNARVDLIMMVSIVGLRWGVECWADNSECQC